MTNDSAASHWSLDKRIPVALLLALLVQLGAGIWFVSAINVRVSNLESIVAAQVDTRDKVIRLEVQINSVDDTLKNIDGKVDRLVLDSRPQSRELDR